MATVYSRTFEWRFAQPPEALWPALADTARFNEAAGLPKHVIEEETQPDGSVRFFAQARQGPFRLAWEEIPVEWVDGQWFRHERVFSAGPFRRLTASLLLESDGEGGALGHYTLEATPANLIGTLILKTVFFSSVEKKFTALANSAEAWAAQTRESPYDADPEPLSPEALKRLDEILARLEESENGHGLSRRLADWILSAQEVDLERIRPLELARRWNADARMTTEMCLQSVKEGLLELRWDLLCPRCRGAKLTVATLDRLPRDAHCASCNIGYDRDFARNVELTFHPAPAIRKIETGEFCLFGPMSTPHVKIQLALDPGASRTVPATFEPGDYRLRTLEIGGETDITHSGGRFPETVVGASGIIAGADAPEGEFRSNNNSDRNRTLIVETRAWIRDALTAQQVTAMQTFRDLLPHQVLQPGDEVGVSQVTLMFTDITGSTALYERVGDAAAYHLVREHFTVLSGVIRQRNGAIVKTIGDAVMAAFNNPSDAVHAAFDAQHGLGAFNDSSGKDEIVIKLGLHTGPCIVVTLNEQLDYFGSTINMAARLQGESEGGEIVISDILAHDPGVAAILTAFKATPESRTFKGFDKPIEFVRLTPAALAANAVK